MDMDDIAKNGLPAWTGANFTPTSHPISPSPKLNPSNVRLPKDFAVCITGAGRGLGAAYAKAYAQAGASHVVLAARTPSELDAVEQTLKEVNEGVKVTKVECDVSKVDDVNRLRKAIEEEGAGRLDVLVNNAGFLDTPTGWGPLTDGDAEQFQRTLDVNIFGVYYVTRTLLPLLLGTPGGAKAVVGISSMLSHFAARSISNALSKLALNRFVEFLDVEYKSEGLVSYALYPGGVATKMSTEGTPEMFKAFLVTEAELSAHMLVWLTKERREWLSGRYVACDWDVDELEAKKDEIVKGDKLKMRMAV